MRRPLSRSDPYPRGEYLTAMNPVLDAFVRAHCAVTNDSGWESREHLTREELVALHDAAGARWWRKGEGTLTRGAWVESPALVMARQNGAS